MTRQVKPRERSGHIPAAVVTSGRRGPEDRETSLVAKAFVILDAVAAIRGSATISELSAQTGLPRSTVHRIVTTLVERQALLRTDSGVQLGIRLFELGGLVPAQTRLRKEATPHMSELFASTRQTIHLGVLEGTEVLCTAKIMGHLPVGVPSQMGVRTRAHTCALGKAMLAFAPKSVVDQVIAGGLGAVTPQTITSPARFLAELRVIAQSGVAFDREEGTVGVRCVSAPILDHQGESIAAISVTAPRASFDRSRFAPAVRNAANEVSRPHGYHGHRSR